MADFEATPELVADYGGVLGEGPLLHPGEGGLWRTRPGVSGVREFNSRVRL